MNRQIRLGNAGIRGSVGNGLNLRRAGNYCSALATWLNGGLAVIGSDTRFSTPMLKSIAISSLTAAGCDILDLGIVPAPILHMAAASPEISGGCLIGAGHHGLGWNAIMPINSHGACATANQNQDILNILHSRQFTHVSYEKLGKIEPAENRYEQPYIEYLQKSLNIESIRKRKFKVIVDCCNGSASATAKKIFKEFGVDAVFINDENRGYLPHDPEPRPRTAYQAKAVLEALHADIGFVLNTDATRVSLVTNKGETLSEELTFPLVAEALLSKAVEREKKVITNFCTTKSLDDVLVKYKGELIKQSVGHANAVQSMLETKALLAGDGMGSIVYGKEVPAFDALRTSLTILESMAEKNMSCHELVSELNRYEIQKSKIPCENMKAYSVLEKCRELFDNAISVNEKDGLRFDWEDGWVHIRASETESALRLICEWPNAEKATYHSNLVKRAIYGLMTP